MVFYESAATSAGSACGRMAPYYYNRGLRLQAQQRGKGIFSSIFRTLGKVILPASKVLKNVVTHPTTQRGLKSLARAGAETISDILEDRSPTQSLQENLQRARHSIAQDIRRTVADPGEIESFATAPPRRSGSSKKKGGRKKKAPVKRKSITSLSKRQSIL